MTTKERALRILSTCEHSSCHACVDCVAAAIREAVAEEREACAKIAIDHAVSLERIDNRLIGASCRYVAELIESRKDQP